MLALGDALRIVEELVRRSVAAGRPVDRTLVMVGGTALAAHGIRALSDDVDLFSREFSPDVVVEIEEEARRRHGPAFKLDVTSTENLWGSILVRDIFDDARTLVATFDVAGARYEVRALGVETLFLLKIAAGRERDRDDLPLLAARTTADAVVARFNTLVRWHGDRQALPGFADAVVASLVELLGAGPEVVDRLEIPDYVRRMLWEARRR